MLLAGQTLQQVCVQGALPAWGCQNSATVSSLSMQSDSMPHRRGNPSRRQMADATWNADRRESRALPRTSCGTVSGGGVLSCLCNCHVRRISPALLLGHAGGDDPNTLLWGTHHSESLSLKRPVQHVLHVTDDASSQPLGFHTPRRRMLSRAQRLLQDCNLVLLSGSQQTIYSPGTANQGSQPCRLVVSGAGGCGFAVLDSQNATLFFEGAYSPPGTLPGTLPTGTVLKQVASRPLHHPYLVVPCATFLPCIARGNGSQGALYAHAQDVKLFSADGTVCLMSQSDGNLVRARYSCSQALEAGVASRC